jgi:hypothetical protein
MSAAIQVWQIFFRDEQQAWLDPAFVPLDNRGSQTRLWNLPFSSVWPPARRLRRLIIGGLCPGVLGKKPV